MGDRQAVDSADHRAPSGARHLAAAVVLALAGTAVVRRLRIAAGMRRGDQVVIDAKRARNKRLANRIITTVGRAGKPHSVFAVIHFTGRKSGRPYSTPIRLVEQGGDFVVPLTYGPRSSWYANLRVRPGILQWQGRAIAVGQPELIPSSAVTHLLPPPSRFLIWLDGTQECVRLHRLDQQANLSS